MSGSYGTANDVGIAWTEDGAPVVLAVPSTKPAPDAAYENALVAQAAAVVAETPAYTRRSVFTVEFPSLFSGSRSFTLRVSTVTFRA